MQCALPTRSQFPSPHRNHSGHTLLRLLILSRMVVIWQGPICVGLHSMGFDLSETGC